jgi:lipopolysaccharide transport system permease protein
MHELIIESGRTERQYWRDVWRYRELFYFLAWRDVLVRYKQTVIGVAWAVIRPVLTIAVLTIVFGRVAQLPSAGVPYPVLVFCGMLPWHFFATAFAESSSSLVTNANMISKVYFPRLVIPAGSVITSFVDFAISGVLLVALLFIDRVAPSPMIVVLPVFIAMAFATAFGVGLWVSALMVRYRDFRFVVPFVVQFGLYLSPVGFTSAVAAPHVLPAPFRLWYWLNPMAGVIDGFRWAILGGENRLYWPGLLVSTGVIVLLILSGIRYFRKTERSFADVI